MFVNAVIIIQLFFAIIIGLYFLNLLKSQQGNKVAVEKESQKELENLRRLREISLTEPLSRRPDQRFEDIGRKRGWL